MRHSRFELCRPLARKLNLRRIVDVKARSISISHTKHMLNIALAAASQALLCSTTRIFYCRIMTRRRRHYPRRRAFYHSYFVDGRAPAHRPWLNRKCSASDVEESRYDASVFAARKSASPLLVSAGSRDFQPRKYRSLIGITVALAPNLMLCLIY